MPAYLIPSPDGVPWLTLLVFSPLVGLVLVGFAALLLMTVRMVKLGVTAWMTASIGLALVVWANFDPTLAREGQGALQLVEQFTWIDAIKVDYFLAVDGISLPLVLLTTVMAPIAALASFGLQ